MIKKEDYIVIHRLKSQGISNRKIAKILGINRKTVAKRLKEEQIKPYTKRDYLSKLNQYENYIIKKNKTKK